jgi:transmembrane sensor
MDATDRKKRASAEAAEWFARLQSDEVPRELRAQFVGWLLESPVHVAELLRIAQVHGALDQFESWSRISVAGSTRIDRTVVELAAVSNLKDRKEAGTLQGENVQNETRGAISFAEKHAARFSRRGSTSKTFHAVRRWMVAAVATILLSVVAIMMLQLRGQIIDTERGERREVVLSDGSVVQVDPETRLRVKYTAQARRVFLERGRVLFHVAKNKDRPFLVDADGATVRAVGTTFGVERQSRRLVITVAEGKVLVTPTVPSSSNPSDGQMSTQASTESKDFSSGTAPDIAPRIPSSVTAISPERPKSFKAGDRNHVPESNSLFLSANQQVTVARSGSADSVRAVNSDRELAWAQGRLIFQNEAVATIVTEFNRYNRVQLRVASAELARRPISGVFNAADPEAFIAFLQTVASVTLVRDGDKSITIESARGS